MMKGRLCLAAVIMTFFLLSPLAGPAKADTTEWPPLDPGYHYVTTIVMDNVYTGSGIYAIFRDGTTTVTATDRGDIVSGAGLVAAQPGPDWRNDGTAPQWRRFACPGETNLAAGTWYWNKRWQLQGNDWTIVNQFWVFAADQPCMPSEPLPTPTPSGSPPEETSNTYWKGYPPPPPFSDLAISPPRSVVNLKTFYQVTGGQPDPGQGENVIAIEELPTHWSFQGKDGDGSGLAAYEYRPSHTYNWSSFGQPCPDDCRAEVGDDLDAYRVEVTRRWRVFYERQLWEANRWHWEDIWGECSEYDPTTDSSRYWDCVVDRVQVSDPDALLWSEVREETLESRRSRWLPVIEVKATNLGQQ